MWVRPEDYKRLGAILADVREKKGVTQKELAKRLRKPQSFISAYENGQRRIDVLEFIRIAAALDADPKKVFGQVVAD
jgi:transcriptional regulator with XRE-family HTH domain